jgi:hypothetical protein
VSGLAPQDIELNEPQLPESISTRGVRKFVPNPFKVTVSFGPTAVNLYQTSYALGVVQVPPSGVAEGVAPPISVARVLQLLITDRLTAPVHSSLAKVLTGSTTHISKLPSAAEVGAVALVEYTLIK